MKVKYSSIVGIIAMLVLIASFVVPAKLAIPEPVSAQQPPMEWLPVDTPDIRPGLLKEVFTPGPAAGAGGLAAAGPELGTELIKLLVGNDGTTMYVQYARGDSTNVTATSRVRLLKSVDGGVSWSTAAYTNLNAAAGMGVANNTIVWDIAVAPDNPNVVSAAVSTVTAGGALPAVLQRVFLTTNGGVSWNNTNWPPVAAGLAAATDYISCMDISMDYGSARDILVGVRDGTGAATAQLLVMQVPGFGGWNAQDATSVPVASINPLRGDVITAKFSPTYIGDSSIVVVYTTDGGGALAAGTWLATGVHDTVMNYTTWQDTTTHVSIKNSTALIADSPAIDEIITADLDMPSDFSGQSASLRRFYVSTDSVAAAPVNKGVYRIDDNIVYTLMDNTATSAVVGGAAGRRAHSIDYWGTYASGKLLVGETLGRQCTASVPTWFTDSPTVCPVPCWYPAKKPVSGAAGDVDCTRQTQGYGNAFVVWSPTYAAQGVAYAVTGASSFDGPYLAIPDVGAQQANLIINWPRCIMNVVSLDESAFSLTRNNGETWNQLSLIDTRINKLTDVAPSADCTTIYLASVNNAQACKGFDSIWRSSVNEKVVAPPLPALPPGSIWERVRVTPSALTCNVAHANYIILRLAPDKLDGQILGWAAGGTDGHAALGGFPVNANTMKMEWSPDFGDYFAQITPRLAIQDFAFESSTIIYILEANTGNVQKMPYTGTAWAASIPNATSNLGGGHTIEAKAADKVLVGNEAVLNSAATPFPVAISTDGGFSFVPMTRPIPQAATFGYHAIFDTDYGVGNNTTVYEGSDRAGAGLIHRNNAPAGANIPWTDMCTGFTAHVEYYGLVQSNSKNVNGQGTLYAAHAGNVTTAGLPFAWSGVERTLRPLDGIPKPGIQWDCLDAAAAPFQVMQAQFTLEPKSLKLCGCLTQDTNTTLYAIDNDLYSNNHNGPHSLLSGIGSAVAGAVGTTGMLWSYVDCVAKVGPTLTMDDGTIIGCDPADGRAQEINFTWEQLCIANQYEMWIAKDEAMTLLVFTSGLFGPIRVTSPALVYLTSNQGTMPATVATSALECGHTYYWWLRVRDETTNDAVRSPWSDIRTFTIKAGFRVTTPYYGPQLLAPDNGCGCACDAPICFSWSPFKETMKYKFELSENSDLSSPLVSTEVGTTAYQYTGTVKCNKNYFWRVQAVAPAPSEWSAVFSFMTQPEPPAPPAPAPAPEIPMWVWILIAIGAIFVIVLIVLIFKTRRV